MEADWLNLSEAAEMLGVHPATLRSWADKGDVPSRRTAGGHRRFERVVLTQRVEASQTSSRQQAGAQVIVQNVMGKTRLEFDRLESEPWYQQLSLEGRRELGHLGRRLMQLVQQHLSEDDDASLQQANQIGSDYERLGFEHGLTLTQTISGYLFFREFLFRTLYDMMEAAGVEGPTDWRELHQRATTLSNEVLIAMSDANETRYRN